MTNIKATERHVYGFVDARAAFGSAGPVRQPCPVTHCPVLWHARGGDVSRERLVFEAWLHEVRIGWCAHPIEPQHTPAPCPLTADSPQ